MHVAYGWMNFSGSKAYTLYCIGMSSHNNILLDKLEGFIRKYYKNLLLRGGIYTFSIVLGWYLVVTLLEYVGKFSGDVRAGMLISLFAVSGYVLYRFILIPGFRLFRLGKRLSYDDAAMIVGRHFPEIEDKLLNTIQLQREGERKDDTLLLASVEQRIGQLRPVPFTSAVRYGDNRKYLRYAFPPLIVLLAILFTNASILTESTDRIVNYDEEFKEPPPFRFELMNTDLEVAENEPITLRVRISGDKIPSRASVRINGATLPMKKESANIYSYTFKAKKSATFYFKANGIESDKYSLNILPRPVIRNFSLEIDYPEYTGRQDETIENKGDLVLPQGSRITWQIGTEHTQELNVRFGDSLFSLDAGISGFASFSRMVMESVDYSIISENQFVTVGDSVWYALRVVPDQYPSISMIEEVDTTDDMMRYFSGEVSDDYGIRGVTFSYKIADRMNGYKTVGIPVNTEFTTISYMHYLDLHQLGLEPGDRVEYFFTVTDNDGVNGPKSSRTTLSTYRAPTKEELEAMHDQSNDQMKESMNQAMQEAAELKRQMQRFSQEMKSSNTSNWKKQMELQDLMKKQQQLQERVKNLNEQFEEDKERQEEFEQYSEEMLEKKEMLEELMEELMTDEMKEMLEEIQELMEKYNEQEINEKMEDYEFEMDNYEKQLERLLEQFKQMEMDEKLNEMTDEMEEMIQKEEDIEEKTENATKEEMEQLAKDQEELKKEMEDMQRKLDDLEKMNQELDFPREMPDMESLEEQIKQDMQESQEQLEKGRDKKAQESQQGAKSGMQKMQQQMEGMKSQQSQQQKEDMDALRQLLDNILTLSLEQEDLMEDMRGLDVRDPQYFEAGRMQRKLSDDSEIIRDSLFALSKRVPQIESMVNQEMSQINRGMERSTQQISERNGGRARAEQQVAMTSLNNLALMLSETLEQMQQQMASQMPGTGMCEKPGGSGAGKPSAMPVPSMQQMQQDMQQQLEQMQQMLKNSQQQGGQKPGDQEGDQEGGKKPGQQGEGQGQGNQGKPGQGGQPGQGNAEQFAKMAAQQAAIREKMRELRQQMNSDGSGRGNALRQIEKEIEETEEDLINRELSIETIRRQQDIMTRLLEHEKAERERGWDEQRESREGKDQENGNPEKFLEYKRRKSREVELLRTIPPDLMPYYKQKVNEYFNSVVQ